MPGVTERPRSRQLPWSWITRIRLEICWRRGHRISFMPLVSCIPWTLPTTLPTSYQELVVKPLDKLHVVCC